jgi:hypothetical protein
VVLSKQRSQDIINALRRGTVPKNSLDAFATGLDGFREALDHELEDVKSGKACFKAIRGDYGCGKTFFARWFSERAKELGFATSEVQISETETPLYSLEKVYRRVSERIGTSDCPEGAYRNILDSWFFTLESDILREKDIDPSDEHALIAATNDLMEKRLSILGEKSQTFSIALRAYRRAQLENDLPTADAISAWLAGQPNIAAQAKRYAGIKGDIDHFAALTFLQGVLTILRDSGYAGLLIVLDEVETVQRMRSDIRDKSLNALRQLMDEIDGGRFPGLYLLITGTPAFFDGPLGIKRLEPLAQRLHVDFQTDQRFDNPRAVQMRLAQFDMDRLVQIGNRIREIYEGQCGNPERIRTLCDDTFVRDFAGSVAGKLGGKVGLAPRIFLKKLVADLLDRIDQFEEFDPRKHYSLRIDPSELSELEREAAGIQKLDNIVLDLEEEQG